MKNRYRAKRTEAGSSGGGKAGVDSVRIRLMQHIVVCRMKPPVFSGEYTLGFRMLQEKYSPEFRSSVKKPTLRMAPRDGPLLSMASPFFWFACQAICRKAPFTQTWRRGYESHSTALDHDFLWVAFNASFLSPGACATADDRV
jgi:hypothetical protein